MIILFILSGCTAPSPVPGGILMSGERISYKTQDGVEIVGTRWRHPALEKPTLILIHQFGKDHHSFDGFAEKAFARGYSIISLDVRGHGDSRIQDGNKEALSYIQFPDSEFQKIEKDILESKQLIPTENAFLIGASIGANAALNAASRDASFQGIILLSPGMSYKGIDVQENISRIQVPVLIVASKDDPYSSQSAQTIFPSLPLDDKQLLLLQESGHGTDMLIRHPSLADDLLDWLDAHSP
ncbi:MAG: alpha/beta fold hydrolase [Candidatus Diapherotrites archaeon]|nr:alpha/beta fold hydrolase [Candidatus Diapherotrites archaeon]